VEEVLDDVVDVVVGTEVVEEVVEVEVEDVDGVLVVLVVCSLVVVLVVGTAEEEVDSVVGVTEAGSDWTVESALVEPPTVAMTNRFELTNAMANEIQWRVPGREKSGRKMRSSKHSNQKKEKRHESQLCTRRLSETGGSDWNIKVARW
jgi:hypothetical protein